MALICLVCGRHKCDDVEPVYGITYYENGTTVNISTNNHDESCDTYVSLEQIKVFSNIDFDAAF
jgi:hypothetical protein